MRGDEIPKQLLRISRGLRVALVVVPIALVLTTQTVAAAPSDTLCWQSLEPDTGAQDMAAIYTLPALASTGPDEVWLTWQEQVGRILRWTKGRWSPAPKLARPGIGPMRAPLVVVSPAGKVMVAALAGPENWARDGDWVEPTRLHIARANEGAWEWLGAPLLSSPSTRPNDIEAVDIIGIGFFPNGHPVVAWEESSEHTPARPLVARYDGSSWRYFGMSSAVGARSQISFSSIAAGKRDIWLGGREGLKKLRVVRWEGAAWRDVGGAALDTVAGLESMKSGVSLVVDDRSRAWLLWIAGSSGKMSALAMARWDGRHWTTVPAPTALGGRDGTVSSAAMILRGGRPLLAWSQEDETENSRLYVSEWAEGDGWRVRLAGLHLVEGVSSVRDVRLAAGDDRAFFVAWDEPGKDKRRTRLVRACTCAADETPAPPPKSVVERDTWPTTVDEAAGRFANGLDQSMKRGVRKKLVGPIVFREGWGVMIKKSYGLWRGNTKLLESCGRGKQVDAEECSMIIFEAVWKLLQGPAAASPQHEPTRR